MNDDTNEALLWCWNETEYKECLLNWIGNELVFISHICTIINEVNNRIGFENRINTKNVNGNEIYIRFLELTENENEPHW